MNARIACLAIALLSLLTSGCTAIGIVAGVSVDRRNARACHVSWDSLRSVPRGRVVEVTLASGDTLRGEYTGLRALPADSYRSAYDSTRTLLGDSVLPRIGEIVSVIPQQGRSFSGVFYGFEAEALAVRRTAEDTLFYQALSGAARLQKYYGKTYNLERLRTIASERALPSRRELTIQTTGGTYGVPLQAIEQVYARPRYTYYAFECAAIGLLMDAFMVGLMTDWTFSINLNVGPSF
jgi:hypothetical protein